MLSAVSLMNYTMKTLGLQVRALFSWMRNLDINASWVLFSYSIMTGLWVSNCDCSGKFTHHFLQWQYWNAGWKDDKQHSPHTSLIFLIWEKTLFQKFFWEDLAQTRLVPCLLLESVGLRHQCWGYLSSVMGEALLLEEVRNNCPGARRAPSYKVGQSGENTWEYALLI